MTNLYSADTLISLAHEREDAAEANYFAALQNPARWHTPVEAEAYEEWSKARAFTNTLECLLVDATLINA